MNVRKKNKVIVRGMIVLLILSVFISSACALELADLQWGEGATYRLQRGEIATYMGYSIEPVMFPPPVPSEIYRNIPAEPVDPYVGLNISKNGIFINTTVLGPGNSYILPDTELRITAKELPQRQGTEWLYESYSPWVVAELNPRGKPNLEVSIDTDNEGYLSSSATEIVSTVTLGNTGTGDAVNVDLTVATELPVKRGTLKYHYERIKKGETITSTIVFSTPILMEKKSYDVLANASGYDVKDLYYTSNFLKPISILPESLQMPTLKKVSNAKMYLNGYYIVSLTLKNNAKYELKYVSITDTLPASFKLSGNISLHWLTNISPYGEWSYRYMIKPQEPNKDGIVLPSATAEFRVNREYYMIQSNQPVSVVYGPKIVLNKNTDVSEVNQGDSVTVRVEAENIGSTPTKVAIKDELPGEVTLLSGSTALEEYLEAGKKVSFSYTFKMDSEQPVRLPSATAEYYELGTKGAQISTKSQELEIRIRAPEAVTTSEPAPEVTVPEPAFVITSVPASQPDNATSSGAVTKIQKKEPEPIKPPPEVSALLNTMLGCDNSNISSRTNATQKACNLIRQ